MGRLQGVVSPDGSIKHYPGDGMGGFQVWSAGLLV